MLVLSRKTGETVVIGGDLCKITVLELRGEQVRLGFEADRAITILRGELGSWTGDTRSNPNGQPIGDVAAG